MYEAKKMNTLPPLKTLYGFSHQELNNFFRGSIGNIGPFLTDEHVPILLQGAILGACDTPGSIIFNLESSLLEENVVKTRNSQKFLQDGFSKTTQMRLRQWKI